MIRALILAGVTVPLAWLSLPGARIAPCPTPGCLTGTASGKVAKSFNGTAWYRVTGNRVMLVLGVKGAPELTIVIARDSAGLPRGPDDVAYTKTVCDEDDPAEERPADEFNVSIRGGPPVFPRWLAAPSGGTLELRMEGELVVGTFDLSACGEDIVDDESVRVDVKGSFRAVRVK
jgi:hypothetical protein